VEPYVSILRRRAIIQCLALFGFAALGGAAKSVPVRSPRTAAAAKVAVAECVIVDGWILKRSDLDLIR
jgi:hypothetical protein